MQHSLRPFWLTLLALWTVLSFAAIAYSQAKNIAAATLLALLPAFLLEAGLYLASGTEAVRHRIESFKQRNLALVLLASALSPYTLYTLGLDVFSWTSFALLALLAGAASFWYVVLKPSTVADLAFFGLMAAVVIAKLFTLLYPEPPQGRVGVAILGQAMWIRVGLVVVLSIRRMGGIGFSFMPRPRDWGIGIRNYLIFLPVGLAAGTALGFLRPNPTSFGWRTVLLAVGTFFAFLWLVALSEEFFFRGVLQQRLGHLLSPGWIAIVVTSVLFGLVHLGFGQFPNWRFVILAGLASLFYGRAYAQAQSIRASMVTHALVVTTWRVFL